MKVSQARQIAFKVLLSFEKKEIRFLKESLNRYIDDSGLKREDIALATEIAYGVMRWRGFLDYIIDRVSKKKIPSMDNEVLIILRMAIYQVLFLNRIPERAIVDEAARLAYFCRKKSAAAFINGILREFLRIRSHQHSAFSIQEQGSAISDEELASACSHPEWMVKKWVERFGVDGAKKLCEFNNTIPPNAIRVNTNKISSDQLLKLLEESGIDCKPSRYCKDGLIVSSLQEISKNFLFEKGYFYIQDEASMLVSEILKPQEGERILDLCAAPGGKATHIAQIIGKTGLIIAMDNNLKRLQMIGENCRRMEISMIKRICGDGKNSSAMFKKKFDRVLVDAPCSGTGILRRNPEIKWIRNYEDLVNLKKLQTELLAKASECVNIDRILVYSTCSSEAEENQEVIEAFLSDHKNFVLEKVKNEIHHEARKFITEEGYFYSVPVIEENPSMDIFFVSKMRRIN